MHVIELKTNAHASLQAPLRYSVPHPNRDLALLEPYHSYWDSILTSLSMSDTSVQAVQVHRYSIRVARS